MLDTACFAQVKSVAVSGADAEVAAGDSGMVIVGQGDMISS